MDCETLKKVMYNLLLIIKWDWLYNWSIEVQENVIPYPYFMLQIIMYKLQWYTKDYKSIEFNISVEATGLAGVGTLPDILINRSKLRIILNKIM